MNRKMADEIFSSIDKNGGNLIYLDLNASQIQIGYCITYEIDMLVIIAF